MKSFSVFIVAAVFAASAVVAKPNQYLFRHHPEGSLRLCVPDAYLSLCREMIKTRPARHHDNPDLKIQCISAPDKIACVDSVIKGHADWTIVDPEELYTAYRFLPQNGVVVSSEIRSAEYSTRNYKYASAVVIRKNAGIQTIADLKGKRSCHSGFGKNTGWNIPFSHLFLQGQINCTKEGNALERDLSTFAAYFGESCIPGQWSSDMNQDINLKKNHSSLCQRCKNPETCSISDNYASYDGALRCLTENDGQVAWTKYDAVQDYFKLNESTPTKISEEYELLCRDGSKMPLNSENPCSWATVPWRAVVITNHFSKNLKLIQELQNQITSLQQQALKSSPPPQWLAMILENSKETDVIYHHQPQRVKVLTPQYYLQPSNYSQTFWHPSCGIYEKSLKICIYNQVELQKCEALRLAAISHRISPGFSCVLGTCAGHCSSLVSKGQADLLVADPKSAYKIRTSEKYSPELIPILRELVPGLEPNSPLSVRYAVAVIRNEIADQFTTNSLSPLKGKRSCHGSVRNLAGVAVPVSVLRDANELTKEICQVPQELADYFGQMCVPGAKEGTRKFANLPVDKFCALCAGDTDGIPHPGIPTATNETICSDNDNERYYGNEGAIQCLKDEVADVAFVDHLALLKIIGQKTKERTTNLKLLCKNGTVASLEEFKECYWGMVGTTKIMARGGEENRILRENAKLSLLKAQELFRPDGKNKGVFKLFGEYYGTNNVIFQDSALGFREELPESEYLLEEKYIEGYGNCKGETGAKADLRGDEEWKPAEQV